MSLVHLWDVTRTVTLPDGEDLHILRGVNLDVAAGEHVSIVGRSGTGKSTMLNIIGLLDAPTSGTYELDGVDTTRLGEGRRARMRGEDFGFVFQQFNIFAARTAAENVEVPLLYASGAQLLCRRSIALDMLERVGLADRADSHPGEMSGGEQQRIAIARALVRRPRVILADEPTGALDPDTGRAVMTLLEEVARESDSALIVITHDMAVAARASRAYELYDGVLHEVTDPGTLTQRAEAGNSGADNAGTGGSTGIPGNPWDEASAVSAGPQPPPPPAQVPAPPSGGSPDDTGVTARQTMRAVRRAAARQRESEQ
ncbi:ABC transporter ATP-binding protein [uncultured Actinomyces sp.]|uniref:ABC transporter ATP-binding protein n=1 Tax=uncultured Actinomyces sp. TaxID=249061 RepID=UPI0028D87EA2|nr:ABC transporter ATP-binding protein [uncultured Actinomyces sp.]